jgi:hypothetical protein
MIFSVAGSIDSNSPFSSCVLRDPDTRRGATAIHIRSTTSRSSSPSRVPVELALLVAAFRRASALRALFWQIRELGWWQSRIYVCRNCPR